MLHTFNRIGDRDIWHIHGEARRKSSTVFTHDEYARLVFEVLAHNKDRKNDYEVYNEDVKFQSWTDYFILGDLYILGLGMDFSEFDLWWLLSRRQREKAEVGKVLCYAPEGSMTPAQIKALNELNVDVLCGGFCKTEGADNTEMFKQFYSWAINDIEKKIENNKTKENEK